MKGFFIIIIKLNCKLWMSGEFFGLVVVGGRGWESIGNGVVDVVRKLHYSPTGLTGRARTTLHGTDERVGVWSTHNIRLK